MDALLERANLFFARVPDRVRRYRLWVWLLLFVSSALVISGAGRFHIDMTMEAYFQRDDPAKLAYDRFRAEFGSDEVVFLSYRAQDGDVFSDASLKALQGLHRELRDYRLTLPVAQSSGLDHIREITSLINASFMHARDGVLLSTPLIGEQLPATEQEREALRRKTLSHPDYPGVYVSEDSATPRSLFAPISAPLCRQLTPYRRMSPAPVLMVMVRMKARRMTSTTSTWSRTGNQSNWPSR